MILPSKTIERLSQYRRVLQKYQYLSEPFIFSHDLAKLLRIKPVQVRRDLMLMGISGNYRNGYRVTDLLKSINQTLTIPKSQYATIIGMGNLGQSLLKHISSNPECPVSVKAVFDTNPKYFNQKILDIDCYDMTRMPEMINMLDIKIAILCIVSEDIQNIVDIIIDSGIKGIVNYIAGPIRIPDHIYFKEYDIRTTLDEMSYFISQ
jgi:redox-sensing transcriptional repressor